MGMVIFHGVIMCILNRLTPKDFGDEEKHQATTKHLITFYISLLAFHHQIPSYQILGVSGHLYMFS
jgi:hypothetical protein